MKQICNGGSGALLQLPADVGSENGVQLISHYNKWLMEDTCNGPVKSQICSL